MIAAFEGWNDAGEAASTALEHLELTWDATPLASVDPEDYYDFQVTRPHVKMAGGITRRIEWHTTRLSVAQIPGTERYIFKKRGVFKSTASRRGAPAGQVIIRDLPPDAIAEIEFRFATLKPYLKVALPA